MHTKRTIALVGNDESAKLLAELLVKGNNRVLFFSRIFEDSQVIVSSVKNKNRIADIEAVPCSYTATWEADIIISIIPFAELKNFAAHIKEVAVQKIFVVGEMMNEEVNNKLNEVAAVQQTLPFTKIISASFSTRQNNAIEYSLRGNNREAVETMHQLFGEAGMLSTIKTTSN